MNHELFTGTSLVNGEEFLLTRWLNDDGTVHSHDIATRGGPGETWGPPITLTREQPYPSPEQRAAVLDVAFVEQVRADLESYCFVDDLGMPWVWFPGHGWLHADDWDDFTYLPADEHSLRTEVDDVQSLIALVRCQS